MTQIHCVTTTHTLLLGTNVPWAEDKGSRSVDLPGLMTLTISTVSDSSSMWAPALQTMAFLYKKLTSH